MSYEYRVISRMTELQRGSLFLATSEVEIETGELALFGVGPSPFDCQYTIVGRWFPGIAGYDWIWQPERWIRIAKGVMCWIIGKIVPIGDGCFEWSTGSNLLIASSAALIELCNL